MLLDSKNYIMGVGYQANCVVGQCPFHNLCCQATCEGLYYLNINFVNLTHCVKIIYFSVLQCRYFVDADVHVPWSPDVEVQQTVLINPPKNIVVSDHVTTVI